MSRAENTTLPAVPMLTYVAVDVDGEVRPFLLKPRDVAVAGRTLGEGTWVALGREHVRRA